MSSADLSRVEFELPPKERLELIPRMADNVVAPTSFKPAASTSQWPDFLTRLHTIYGNKTIGDSQSLISELRGDQ